jgi:hypothetical protein
MIILHYDDGRGGEPFPRLCSQCQGTRVVTQVDEASLYRLIYAMVRSI